jgi:hypothetical protein
MGRFMVSLLPDARLQICYGKPEWSGLLGGRTTGWLFAIAKSEHHGSAGVKGWRNLAVTGGTRTGNALDEVCLAG